MEHPNLALNASAQPDHTKIFEYLELWKKWNLRVNLTSEKDSASFFQRHFFDSLQFCRVVDEQHFTMDIGSGGGFPGLPLKLVYPQLAIVLVESQRKRANFLKQVVQDLGLENVEVKYERSQSLESDPKFSGKFDRVIFRAVTNTLDCLKMGGPFLSSSGKIVLKREVSTEETVQPGFQKTENIPVKGFQDEPSSLWVFSKNPTS